MASQWRPLRDTLRTLRSGSPSPLLRPPSLRARSLSSFHSSSRFRIPSIPSDVGPSPSSYTPSSSSFSSSPPPVSSCTYICSSFSSPLSLAHSLPSPRSHLAIPTPARPFSLPPPPCIPLSPSPLPSSLRLFFSFVQVTLISCAINLSRSKLDLGRYVFTRYYFRPLLHRIDDDVAGSFIGRHASSRRRGTNIVSGP